MDPMISAILAAAGTGIFSAVVTVAAMKVHIAYIRETLEKHYQTISRAHQRIDELEKRS